MGRVRYLYPRRMLTALLSEPMQLAMLRGHAGCAATAQGVLDRRLATHAVCMHTLWYLRFSPFGKQWHRGAVALEMERKRAG